MADEVKKLEDEVKKLKAINKQLEQSLRYANGTDSGLYDEIVESNEYLEDKIKQLEDDLKEALQINSH